MKKPKIVLFDLETLPIVSGHISSLGEYNSDRFGLTMKAENNSIICFGYKILGDKEAKCVSSWDFAEGKKDINNDKPLLEFIVKTLKDADAVVTHNGNRFDIPMILTRLALNKMKPLPELVSLDTCQIARKLFFIRHRLDYLAEKLSTGRKMKHTGWGMWKRLAMSRYKGPDVPTESEVKEDKRVMIKYCKQDVNVMEQIFNLVKPYAKRIPNFNMFTDKRVCPSCGSSNLHKHSIKVTKQGRFQRYQCQDCASISTANKKEMLSR